MKRVTLVIICLNIFAACVFAQSDGVKTIGDKLSAMRIENVYNYEADYIEVPNNSNEHIILDFWASWCAPCINEFSKIDSINRKMDGKLSIIPVTSEGKKTVDKTLQDYKKHRGIDLFSVYADKKLRSLFPYRFLPHYVWINNKGIVVAITDNKALSKENIVRFLKNQPITVAVKKDSSIKINMRKPLFTGNQVSPNGHIIHQSNNAILTNYIPGVSPGVVLEKQFIGFSNVTIRQMFGLALSDFRLGFMDVSRFILDGFTSEMDSLSVGIFRKDNYQKFVSMYRPWQYTFEMVFEDTALTNQDKCSRVATMLNQYFKEMGISGSKVVRKQRVLALTDVGMNLDSLKSKSANEEEFITDKSVYLRKKQIGTLLEKFGTYLPNPSQYPIIDQTGLKKTMIDLEFEADLTSVESLNKALLRFGLQFKEMEIDQEMILVAKEKN